MPETGPSVAARGGQPWGRAGRSSGREHSGPCSGGAGSLPRACLWRAALGPKYPQSRVPTSVCAVLVGGIQEVSGRRTHPTASSTLTPTGTVTHFRWRFDLALFAKPGFWFASCPEGF